jgi:Tfp pilus assembly protein PilX
MYNLHYRRAVNSGQHGAALIVVLLAMVILMVLGVGMLQTSIAGLRTSANDRTSKTALAVAESGIEFAREQLRTMLRTGPITLSTELAHVANEGTLVNATQISAFNGSTGLTNYTTNNPLIPPRAFGAGSFQVFLTNDRCETPAGGICVNQPSSVQSTVDTNNRIMLTSLGTGPGGSLAVVQEQLKVTDAFSNDHLPANIILPGPDIDFEPFTSESPDICGCDSPTCSHDPGVKGYPTIAVSSQAALTTALSFYDSAKKEKYKDKYDDCGPFGTGATNSFENFLPSDPTSIPNPYEHNTTNNPPVPGDPRLVEVAYLQKLVATIKSVADYTSTGNNTVQLGTSTAPAISVIDNPGGEVTYSGKVEGYGILLVTGQLTFKGDVSYSGLILCIGDGRFQYTGNGNGTINGSILVANVNSPYSGNPKYVGVPYYHDTGGGNHKQYYSSNCLSTYANAILPLQRLTFQQLR